MFKSEQNKLERYRQTIENAGCAEEVLNDFKSLCDDYEDLLKQQKIITKISDRLQKKLDKTYQDLKIEQEKSEKLLLNILPVRVAYDLKENGKCQPESFENVTVFFSDIVGFTSISENMEPSLLISELNDLFTNFDEIIYKHSCERIKTIGDAYLAVSGMPIENIRHAENIAKASLEIIKYLQNRNKTNSLKWQIRIGLHSGKVVGGIVGVKKYIYDVFGDTINTASRMESYSEPMKINVSEATYNLIKDKFHFEKREEVVVKGKGSRKMYFLIEKLT
jgi:adenylate cyclase